MTSTMKQSVLVALESTPGTAETLVGSDGDFFQENIAFNPDITQFERKPYKQTFGSVPSLAGQRKASLSFDTELVGSGVVGTAPPLSTVARSCGMSETGSLVKMTIGAITGGPFTLGETVTQATSGATAQVAMVTYTGTTTLWLYNQTVAVFTATDDLTGGTSGATCTPTAEVADAGFMYKPKSTSLEYGTIGVHRGDLASTDAQQHILSYAMGNMTFKFATGNRAIVSVEYMGRLISSTEVGTYLQGTIPAPTPPQWKQDDAIRLLDNYSAVIDTTEINLGNQINPMPNANDPTGYDATVLEDRAVTGQIDPILVLPSGHDFYNKIYDNNTGPVTLVLGDTPGNQIFMQLPRAQYTSPNEGDRNAQSSLNITLEGHETSGDDALVLIFG